MFVLGSLSALFFGKAVAEGIKDLPIPDTSGRYNPDPCKDWHDKFKEAARQYPNKSGKFEWHHIIPKYLVAKIIADTAYLPAPYHQWITNAFRDSYNYGQEPTKVEELERILKEVYRKLPLPPKECVDNFDA